MRTRAHSGVIGLLATLTLAPAWAEDTAPAQADTMMVVAEDAVPDDIVEVIELPEPPPEAATGSAASGRPGDGEATAGRARDHGRAFGRARADAARAGDGHRDAAEMGAAAEEARADAAGAAEEARRNATDASDAMRNAPREVERPDVPERSEPPGKR
ncbi:MAG: hypothetical protein ACODAC_10100 [Pseudomonadota bacterium]